MKTKIKDDPLGLYIRCGGWIGRPMYTKYKSGDKVKATHPAGSNIYVCDLDKRVGSSTCEVWNTDCCYWWHPIEGRGKKAKELRENDVARFPTLYSGRVR